LHNGHIETLKQAKAKGDFLYVGVWGDDIVNYLKGSNYPILSLHERVLMVLACKYVDDVVIEAPFIITEDLIKSLNINEVVNVKTDEDSIS
jgi:ethanolamine-phosphate cytidylyltransferase